MTIALVTDSNSQLPPELVERYDVLVVPIPVNVNGTEYLEGVDLDADGFYRFWQDGAPIVSTSQPSPGAFVEAYNACAAAGATEILSIHITELLSGTLNSARLAAGMVDVPVRLIDSRTASFGIGCCVWRAGERIAAGDAADQVEAAVDALAGQLWSVTAAGASAVLGLRGFDVPAGGLAVDSADGADSTADEAPAVDLYLSKPDGVFEPLGTASTEEAVCDLMAATMTLDGAPIRVAISIADDSAAPYYEGLEQRLRARDDVLEIVRYRIGPSIGAFFGPGTAGGFWFAA